MRQGGYIQQRLTGTLAPRTRDSIKTLLNGVKQVLDLARDGAVYSQCSYQPTTQASPSPRAAPALTHQ